MLQHENVEALSGKCGLAVVVNDNNIVGVISSNINITKN